VGQLDAALANGSFADQGLHADGPLPRSHGKSAVIVSTSQAGTSGRLLELTRFAALRRLPPPFGRKTEELQIENCKLQIAN
jgi:hypothetical protein